MRIKLLVSVNLFRAYVSIYKLHERPIVQEQPFTVSYADTVDKHDLKNNTWI